MTEAIQAALYALLTGDTALMALVKGVYDDRAQIGDPGDAGQFPLVLLGEDTFSPWGTDDWSGSDALLRLHVFSRYAGQKQAKQIVDRLRAIVDRADLAVPGYSAVALNFDGVNFDNDPDGETRNATLTFRLLIN